MRGGVGNDEDIEGEAERERWTRGFSTELNIIVILGNIFNRTLIVDCYVLLSICRIYRMSKAKSICRSIDTPILLQIEKASNILYITIQMLSKT